jgi:hypothetical protein
LNQVQFDSITFQNRNETCGMKPKNPERTGIWNEMKIVWFCSVFWIGMKSFCYSKQNKMKLTPLILNLENTSDMSFRFIFQEILGQHVICQLNFSQNNRGLLWSFFVFVFLKCCGVTETWQSKSMYKNYKLIRACSLL